MKYSDKNILQQIFNVKSNHVELPSSYLANRDIRLIIRDCFAKENYRKIVQFLFTMTIKSVQL